MIRKNLLWLAVSAAVMLALPWLAVTFVKGDAGMAACFLLFFAVNPVYSGIIGLSAGKDVKNFWFQPIISAALFLAGAWIFFDPGETAFLIYGAVYLGLGIAAMLLRKRGGVMMRKCIRCGSAMIENCGIKVKGGAYGIVLTDDKSKWWGGRLGEPNVAICPNCGEVSIYLVKEKTNGTGA